MVDGSVFGVEKGEERGCIDFCVKESHDYAVFSTGHKSVSKKTRVKVEEETTNFSTN